MYDAPHIFTQALQGLSDSCMCRKPPEGFSFRWDPGRDMEITQPILNVGHQVTRNEGFERPHISARCHGNLLRRSCADLLTSSQTIIRFRFFSAFAGKYRLISSNGRVANNPPPCQGKPWHRRGKAPHRGTRSSDLLVVNCYFTLHAHTRTWNISD